MIRFEPSAFFKHAAASRGKGLKLQAKLHAVLDAAGNMP